MSHTRVSTLPFYLGKKRASVLTIPDKISIYGICGYALQHACI